MKRHLFYTFLGIYILTAIVTILGLVGTLTIADKYLGQLVPTVIIETVVAVIALFKGAKFFDESANKELVQTVSGSSSISISSPAEKYIQSKPQEETIRRLSKNSSSSNMEPCEEDIISLSRKEFPTLEEYFKVYEGLEDRFKERAKYISNMENKNVKWQGNVESISESSNGKIVLRISSPNIAITKIVVAFFPKELETDLYSLKKGDIVEVGGVLSLSFPSTPSIMANEISLLKI